MYQSISNYKGARYFWFALVLSLLSILAYWQHQPIGIANGGTWLGYTLGTIGAVLILWLMLLGVRKRSYRSNLGTVQGWTSAHIYLGTALLVIATLHSGIQFGWNVHTFAYFLMVLVIVSGFFGLYCYLHFPNLMSKNRAGESLNGLLEQLEKIDQRCLREAGSGDLHSLVNSAIEGCRIGGSWWQQISAKDRSTLSVAWDLTPAGSENHRPNTEQRLIIGTLADRLASLTGGAEAGVLQGLLASFAAKQVLLQRVRRDVQIRAYLKIWLYIHVPLSFALLAALISHVIVVFYYW